MYNTKGLLFGLLTAADALLALIIPMYVAILSTGKYSYADVGINVFAALADDAPVYGITKAFCVIMLIMAIAGIVFCIIGGIMSCKMHYRAKTFAVLGGVLVIIEGFIGMLIGFFAIGSYKYGAVPYGEIAFSLGIGSVIPFIKFSDE